MKMDKTVIVPLGWTHPELVLKIAFDGRACRVSHDGTTIVYAACIPCKSGIEIEVAGTIEMSRDRDTYLFKFSTTRAVNFELMRAEAVDAINEVVFHENVSNLASSWEAVIAHLRQTN